MAAKRYPGVTPMGGGRYRIRSEMRHPKTGQVHEIDRIVRAKSASDAARTLANERAKWLRARARGEDSGKARRLGDALDAWLRAKRAQVRPSTADRYATTCAWWRSILGDYYLASVEPSDVREALAGAREGGDASETLASRLGVLRTFARETKCGALVEGVRVTRDVREDERLEDEGRGLTLDELRRFLAAGPKAWTNKKGEVTKPWRRAWALVCTMAWTGMRFGEASALEWHDVDLDEGTVRVRRAQWRGVVGHPKAAASKRTVVIPDELVEVLREHRRAMVAGQQPGVESALVFPSRRAGGVYVSNTHARKAVLRVCTAAGIALDGRPGLHSLRHAWNNVLRQNASELVRRALVGHADDASGERYSAITIEERRAAVGSVVRMVRGER